MKCCGVFLLQNFCGRDRQENIDHLHFCFRCSSCVFHLLTARLAKSPVRGELSCTFESRATAVTCMTLIYRMNRYIIIFVQPSFQAYGRISMIFHTMAVTSNFWRSFDVEFTMFKREMTSMVGSLTLRCLFHYGVLPQAYTNTPFAVVDRLCSPQARTNE